MPKLGATHPLAAAFLLAAALLLPGQGLRAKVPGGQPGPPPAPPFHQGELLAASPEMGDSRFREAVILLIRHDAKGAFGLVLNRPLGTLPLGELMRRSGIGGYEGKGEAEERVLLHYGGPVQPELGFVLHTAGEGVAPQTPLAPGYGISPFTDILGAMARGKRPKRMVFLLGYAGWGPGPARGGDAPGRLGDRPRGRGHPLRRGSPDQVGAGDGAEDADAVKDHGRQAAVFFHHPSMACYSRRCSKVVHPPVWSDPHAEIHPPPARRSSCCRLCRSPRCSCAFR